MRNLILALILLLSFCIPSFGATVFNGTSQTIALSDNAVEDFPNNDWTMAGWIQFSARTGTGADTILGTTSAGYIVLKIFDASHATKANKLDLQIFDDGSNFNEALEGTASFASNTSATHVAARRSSNTVTLWVNGSQTATVTGTFSAISKTCCRTFRASIQARAVSGTSARASSRYCTDAKVCLPKSSSAHYYKNRMRLFGAHL